MAKPSVTTAPHEALPTPITPMAPVVTPAAAAVAGGAQLFAGDPVRQHPAFPVAHSVAPGFEMPPGGAYGIDENLNIVRRADPAPVGVGPLPLGAGHSHASMLDRLIRHPDGVVRARAAEAIAARDSRAPDAGILARAAIDTAAELDRSSGRLPTHGRGDGFV